VKPISTICKALPARKTHLEHTAAIISSGFMVFELLEATRTGNDIQVLFAHSSCSQMLFAGVVLNRLYAGLTLGRDELFAYHEHAQHRHEHYERSKRYPSD
jgi:hypothetical protein